MKKIIAGICLVMAATNVSAKDANDPLTAQAELGFLMSSGNSESRSINGKLSAEYNLEKWKYKGAIDGLSAASADPDVPGSEMETSAQRYGFNLQADRKLQNNHSLFVKGSYDDDRFSGFDYETSASLGYGHQVIKSPRRNFRVEVGPGFRISQPEVGEREDEAVIATSFLFDQRIGDTSKFSQILDIDAGDERTISTSVTSLSAQIVGQLAMKLSFTMKHNSDPAIDEDTNIEKESLDKETSINLVYSF